MWAKPSRCTYPKSLETKKGPACGADFSLLRAISASHPQATTLRQLGINSSSSAALTNTLLRHFSSMQKPRVSMTAAFDDHGTSPARELPPQQSTGALEPLDIPPDELKEADHQAENKEAEEKRQSMMRSTSFRSRQHGSVAPSLTPRRWLSVCLARLCFRRSWHLCCLLQLPCRLMTTMALYQNLGPMATLDPHQIQNIVALP
jgi:hypothetical protein